MKITLKDLVLKSEDNDFMKWFAVNFGNDADSKDIINKLNDEKTTENWEFLLAENFKLSGEYKRWHDNGRQCVINQYKDGKLDGVLIS